MHRFCVLIHDHPFVHWDFLLESGDHCRTWRLLEAPHDRQLIRAEVLPHHRLMYLDYEGLVSNNRGTVKQLDSGTFEWRVNEVDRVEVMLKGRTLVGTAILQKEPTGDWSLRFEIINVDLFVPVRLDG